MGDGGKEMGRRKWGEKRGKMREKKKKGFGKGEKF